MRNLLKWVLLVSPLLFALPASAQFARMSFPADGSTVVGTTTLSAHQLNTSIDSLQVGSVNFEYSVDGVTWTLIASNSSAGDGNFTGSSTFDWDVTWNTTTLASGNATPASYRVRASFILINGLIFRTLPITVVVNAPPMAVATGTISASGLALFDGTGSTVDPSDGIVSYDWDFGDGSTATGPTPSHPFSPGQYIVTLTITAGHPLSNGLGAQSTDYLQVTFSLLPPIAQIIRNLLFCTGTNVM